MMKWMSIALAALVVAAGVVAVIRHNASDTPAVRIVAEEAAKPPGLRLRCVHCGHEFAPAGGTPVPGQQGLIVCPKCNKPTPAVPQKAHP